MIFGRSTQQIMAAIVITLQGLKQVIPVIAPGLDPAAVGTVLDYLTALAGAWILVLANTKTTPTDSPQLKANTTVSVVDEKGTRIGDVQLPTPPPAPVAQDVAPGTPEVKKP